MARTQIGSITWITWVIYRIRYTAKDLNRVSTYVPIGPIISWELVEWIFIWIHSIFLDGLGCTVGICTLSIEEIEPNLQTFSTSWWWRWRFILFFYGKEDIYSATFFYFKSFSPYVMYPTAMPTTHSIRVV